VLYRKRLDVRTIAGARLYRTQVIDTDSTPPNSPIAGAQAFTQEKADRLALRAAQAQGIDPADIHDKE
jgi:hypothetical protein